MKSLEQAIHDALWNICLEACDNVFEVRPKTETEYPFIDFGDATTNYASIKHVDAMAEVDITLNIWDTELKRSNVSHIANAVMSKAATLREAYSYPVTLKLSECSSQILKDTTVTPLVWHGVLSLKFTL